MQLYEIRNRFVNYYQNFDFKLLPKAPMMHPSIPMSFVMSAGLIQVETSLADAENRDSDKYVLVQDCFRHFDLDKVGTDDTHLSMFEMPGAFVFGDNGKQKAITQMWHLATKILGIDPRRIWVTYFGGGDLEGHNLPKDEETYSAWKAIGIPEERLIGLGIEENYWVQGGTLKYTDSPYRKCGPNTELFYDRFPEEDTPFISSNGINKHRFVEFSNSLFISYHHKPKSNHIIPMEDPFTETVIGSERVAMILQNADSVFETETYQPVMEHIERCIANENIPERVKRGSKHVITDYMRGLYTLIADEAPPPGKNGRERLIKILIRGVISRTLILLDLKYNNNPRNNQIINQKIKSFLTELIPVIAKSFTRDDEVKITNTQNKILSYFDMQLTTFQKTINRGKRKLNKMLNKKDNGNITAEKVVHLEKTFGLPKVLTYNALREKGITVPEKVEYKEALVEWRENLDN